MKKIISVILIVMLVISAIPTSALAEDREREKGINEIKKTIKSKKIPCYGDYEILSAEGEANSKRTNKATSKDNYETNNSFSKATRINPKSNGRPSNINKVIEATLHRETWLWGLIKREIDEDYFRFDIFGNANVTITMTNIPSNCDYDLELYRHDNVRYSQEDSITLIASSAKNSNNNETITRSLEPGTYYIRIYAFDDNCDGNSPYKLSVSASYKAQNESISSLRFDKGAKAALWVSDYDPFGIMPFSQHSKVEVGIQSYDTYSAIRKFNNPFIDYFPSGKLIEHATLYVWGKNFRKELYDELDRCCKQLTAEIKNEQALIKKISYVKEAIGGLTAITSIILTVAYPSSAAITVTSIALNVAPASFGIVAGVLLPEGEWGTSKANLLNYINNVKTALETSAQTGDDEVVKISSRYKLTSDYYVTSSISNTTRYYCDFTPEIQTEYLYSSDIIQAWNNNSVVNGKIYGITNANDLERALNRIDYTLPDVNTGSVRRIFLNSSVPDKIALGEYHWYKFTAPTTGTYYFYTENSFDTYGELFSNVVPARSIQGRLDFNDDYDEDINFRISYKLTAGQTVYLRVSGYNRMRYGNYSVRVSRGN